MHRVKIEVPVIGLIEGPATRHAEIALLADIVLADGAVIQGSDHFQASMVPGDGMQILQLMLRGANRARYFLLR